MNKLEFLTRLRNSLERGGLNPDDINDALSYYEEVFLDAGFGNEEETAASMGSPEEVAVNILRESGIHVGGAPVMPPQRQGAPQQQGPYDNGYVPPKKKASGGAIALGVILGILTFPIWLPVLIIVVVVLFTAIIVLASLIFAFIAAAVGLIIGGIVTLFEFPALGMIALGLGLVLTGIVMLICKPAFGAAIPAMGRGIKRFCGWLAGLFKKGGKENV